MCMEKPGHLSPVLVNVKEKNRIVHDALKSISTVFPNSVVGDLMMIFPDDVVMKFISAFSGLIIHVPKVETVWKTYRNAVIKETLDVKNDRVNRDRLAAYFGISAGQVSDIYSGMKRRGGRIHKETVKRTAQVIYRSKFDSMLKDARRALR